MIAGLCESPLTFQAIIIWRDELNEGKILLRDIIDLEATYAGPDAKTAPGRAARALRSAQGRGREAGRSQARASAAARAAARRAGAPTTSTATCCARRISTSRRSRKSEDDDEGDDLGVSLSAMEAELKPKVLEIFDNIAKTYKSLRKLQDQEVAEKTELSPSQERRYKKLRDDIIDEVKSLSLNNARIEALVEQLYDINKRLERAGRPPDAPGRDLPACRATSSSGNIRASELDPDWLKRVGRLAKHGWKKLGQRREGLDQGHPRRDLRARHRHRPADPRIPPHRRHGAEGRARGRASPRRKWSRPTCAS